MMLGSSSVSAALLLLSLVLKTSLAQGPACTSACEVTCTSNTACQSSAFTASVVSCLEGACPSSSFDACTVDCDGAGGSCANDSSFTASTATCSGSSACGGATFSSSTAICSFEACASSAFTTSTATCQGSSSCIGSTFKLSAVSCDNSLTCSESKFEKSAVDCSNGSCASSSFNASQVNCGDSSSCSGATFGTCSCCDGGGCGDSSVPSCKTNLAEFCGKCAAFGNPACNNRNSLATRAAAPTATFVVAIIIFVMTAAAEIMF